MSDSTLELKLNGTFNYLLGSGGYLPGKKAFIFSLRNLRGLSPFKMELKSNKQGQAAKQDKSQGPIFGDGDIYIGTDSLQYVTSNTDLDKSFEFPAELSLSADEQDRLLAGSKEFVVEEMEVFYYFGKIS